MMGWLRNGKRSVKSGGGVKQNFYFWNMDLVKHKFVEKLGSIYWKWRAKTKGSFFLGIS